MLVDARVAHWDVNNEQNHGTWYEINTNNVNFTEDLFRTVADMDGTTKLFTNDYNIVSKGTFNLVKLHLDAVHAPVTVPVQQFACIICNML